MKAFEKLCLKVVNLKLILSKFKLVLESKWEKEQFFLKKFYAEFVIEGRM